MGERRRDWNSLFEEASETIGQWRTNNPQVTFNEIEATVNKEMARVRA